MIPTGYGWVWTWLPVSVLWFAMMLESSQIWARIHIYGFKPEDAESTVKSPYFRSALAGVRWSGPIGHLLLYSARPDFFLEVTALTFLIVAPCKFVLIRLRQSRGSVS